MLILMHKLVARRIGVPLSEIRIRRRGDIIFTHIASQADPLLVIIRSAKSVSLQTYLDKFTIVRDSRLPSLDQAVVDALFDEIAFTYESIIDVKRNMENIDLLFETIAKAIGPLTGATILDLGCGTGLSVQSRFNRGINLIGIDRSPKMRDIALLKGMRVAGIKDFENQCVTLDGIFASYVFHLMSDTSILCPLWKCLKPGGVMIANFHKNRGVESINEIIVKLNGSIIELDQPDGSERHGAYVEYHKQK